MFPLPPTKCASIRIDINWHERKTPLPESLQGETWSQQQRRALNEKDHQCGDISHAATVQKIFSHQNCLSARPFTLNISCPPTRLKIVYQNFYITVSSFFKKTFVILVYCHLNKRGKTATSFFHVMLTCRITQNLYNKLQCKIYR